MATINPKIFEGWEDPEGGEWIKIKSGTFDGIIWRPIDLDMDEEGRVSFKVECFESPDSPTMPEEGTHAAKQFETVCGSCIKDILTEAVAANAPLDG